MAFDHINVGCPAAEGNELLLDSCSSYFLSGSSAIYPVWGMRIPPLLSGSVIYPVEGKVKYSFAFILTSDYSIYNCMTSFLFNSPDRLWVVAPLLGPSCVTQKEGQETKKTK